MVSIAILTMGHGAGLWKDGANHVISTGLPKLWGSSTSLSRIRSQEIRLWIQASWLRLAPPLSRWLRKIIVPSGVAIFCTRQKKSWLQNSFNWIEDYNGYNPITKERESLDWFSSLFKAGFFTWRWRVSLVLRWSAEHQVSLVDSLFGSTGGVAQLLSVMESQRDLKNLNLAS